MAVPISLNEALYLMNTDVAQVVELLLLAFIATVLLFDAESLCVHPLPLLVQVFASIFTEIFVETLDVLVNNTQVPVVLVVLLAAIVPKA